MIKLTDVPRAYTSVIFEVLQTLQHIRSTCLNQCCFINKKEMFVLCA